MVISNIFSSPNGLRVVSNDTVYDADLKVLYTHPCKFTSISCSDEAYITIADVNKLVTVFDNQNFSIICQFAVKKTPTSLAVKAEKVYATDRFGDVHAFDLSTKQDQIIAGTVSTLTSVTVTESQVLTADKDEKIRSFDVERFELDGFLLGHEEYVAKILLVDNDKLVSAGGDRYACVWDITSPINGTRSDYQFKIELPVEKGVYDLSIAGQYVLVAFDDSCIVAVLDINAGSCVKTIEFESPVVSVCRDHVALKNGTVHRFSDDQFSVLLTVPGECDEKLLASFWKSKYRKVTTYDDHHDSDADDQEGKKDDTMSGDEESISKKLKTDE